jgi:hypothetical protein
MTYHETFYAEKLRQWGKTSCFFFIGPPGVPAKPERAIIMDAQPTAGLK